MWPSLSPLRNPYCRHRIYYRHPSLRCRKSGPGDPEHHRRKIYLLQRCRPSSSPPWKLTRRPRTPPLPDPPPLPPPSLSFAAVEANPVVLSTATARSILFIVATGLLHTVEEDLLRGSHSRDEVIIVESMPL